MQRFHAEYDADAYAFDPLANMTESPETNDVFRRVGKRLSRLADTTNSAVELVHHARKLNGKETEVEDSRGGVALIGAVRSARALNPMTEEEANKAGLETHIDHFRIEAAGKSNLARPSPHATWYERVSLEIPNGDHVAVPRAWEWPDAFDGLSRQDARRVQVAIGEADPAPRENAQAKDWAGRIVADVLGLDVEKKAVKARIIQLLKGWIAEDVLTVEYLKSGRDGRDVPVIVVGSNSLATVT